MTDLPAEAWHGSSRHFGGELPHVHIGMSERSFHSPSRTGSTSMGRQGPCMLRTRKCARVQTWARHVLSLAVALVFCAAPTLTTTGACSSPSAPALDRIGVRKGCEVVGKHGKHPHGSAHLPQSTQIALALRLRGGHRMPNKKKRNALEQHRTSRRIHSTNRPRDQKRQEQRRAAFQQLEEDDDEAEDVSFNLTEAMLNVSNPKLRLWETTMVSTPSTHARAVGCLGLTLRRARP